MFKKRKKFKPLSKVYELPENGILGEKISIGWKKTEPSPLNILKLDDELSSISEPDLQSDTSLTKEHLITK